MILNFVAFLCQLLQYLEVGQKLGEVSDSFEGSTVLENCQQIQVTCLAFVPTDRRMTETNGSLLRIDPYWEGHHDD